MPARLEAVEIYAAQLHTVDPGGEVATGSVDLTAAERKILVKACLKLRRSLPVYLRSAQSEVAAIDRLLDKLR